MSDHITECPACYTEIQVSCEFSEHAAEIDRLRARLKDRERRIRLARKALRGNGLIHVRVADALGALVGLRRPLKGKR